MAPVRPRDSPLYIQPGPGMQPHSPDVCPVSGNRGPAMPLAMRKGIAVADYHVREEGRGSRPSEYWPLAALTAVALLAGLAIGSPEGRVVMHGFMGVFLVFFALLKLFDPEGFKDGFAMYDLLARRVRGWG